ncbi:DNA-processing protein DprA [Schumannella luteola]|uniref:DNA processing protein n=1 Tax=Schumannella luteola TaxID=472059 RepID=A0A852YGR3_9MICO|nr:DNA-processing protein DprA [Schumannella luteola]NYG99017.1 DNA processing protein [Schumannella luteola]TPX06375.1 DNA-protecting protein DprA [Schumannella luteola]
MSALGISKAAIAQLVRGVVDERVLADAVEAGTRRARSDEADHADRTEWSALEERFARGVWSCLVEPGDRVAGMLIAALGAPTALRPLIDESGADGWIRLLADRADSTDDPTGAATALLAQETDEDRPSEGSSGAASVRLASELAAAAERWRPRFATRPVEIAFRQAERFGTQLVVPGDPDWPARLDDLGPHGPVALWARGDRGVLTRLDDSIALVGARAATGYGEHVTAEASAGLVDRGYAVVSGAAYGIDGVAHRAALASGGDTVAVLAGGLDRFYPSGHEALLQRIVERGVVIAEVPAGSAPTKWRFLQRNRLIAALSAATVIVEAGRRSGSLNTAGHAAELGRPLGAVPGPVTSTASAGCHRLLRDYGATCVTNADEMAELAPHSGAGKQADAADPSAGDGCEQPARPRTEGPSAARRSPDPDGATLRVVDALAPRAARTVLQLATASGLAPDRVRAVLGLLELEGDVRQAGSGWVRVSGRR